MNISFKSFRNSILGFILGDAFGVPYEFYSEESMKDIDLNELSSGGFHGQPVGTWSDDSSMMLITMEWLIELHNQGISLENIDYSNYHDLKKKFNTWLQEGHMTPFGECFDAGNQTVMALKGNGLFSKEAINHSSQGNGSLMRIIPFAFIYSVNYDVVRYVATNVGNLTHFNYECHKYCNWYLDQIRLKENGYHSIVSLENKNPSGWVKDTFEFVDEVINIVTNGTLEASSYEDIFKKSMKLAVSKGGDTDTIAALVGGRLGALYDVNILPEDWVKKIVKINYIEDIIKDFYKKYVRIES